MSGKADAVKAFIADLARPFSIYAASLSGAWATITVADKVTTAEGGALVLGVLAGWGTALYAGKAIENTRISGHSAEVEKIRAQASPPPARPPSVAREATPEEVAAHEGQLPPDQRVKL